MVQAFRVIMDEDGLTPYERVLLLLILRHTLVEKRGSSPIPMQSLADKMGVSIRTAQRTVQRLMKRGLLARKMPKGGRGRAPAYSLTERALRPHYGLWV